jgi:hypothetical protein
MKFDETHTVLSLSKDLQIGMRGATLKALEEKMIIDVARVNKDRRRDGDRESKNTMETQLVM